MIDTLLRQYTTLFQQDTSVVGEVEVRKITISPYHYSPVFNLQQMQIWATVCKSLIIPDSSAYDISNYLSQKCQAKWQV